jgi:hypothetical protein
MRHSRRSGEGQNQFSGLKRSTWIPAFAGMTIVQLQSFLSRA